MHFLKLLTTKTDTDVYVNPQLVTRIEAVGAGHSTVFLADGSAHEVSSTATEIVRLLTNGPPPVRLAGSR
jgi:hypothetical protein